MAFLAVDVDEVVVVSNVVVIVIVDVLMLLCSWFGCFV